MLGLSAPTGSALTSIFGSLWTLGTATTSPERQPTPRFSWDMEDDGNTRRSAESFKRALPTPEPSPERAPKRARTTHAAFGGRALLAHEKTSPEFWLPGGNVVVRVHTTYFKLDRAGLARDCGYFQELFSTSSPSQDDSEIYEVIEFCRVYAAPHDLIVGDFTRLLTALRSPMEYFDQPVSQPVALSLLRAADTVSCNVVLMLARTRLMRLWDSRVPPTTSDDSRGYAEAIHMMFVAREYGIPGVLKRIFYELLVNEAFWNTLAEDRKTISLEDSYLLKLYDARHYLQREWREFVLTPPGLNRRGESRCCHYTLHTPSTMFACAPRNPHSTSWNREMRWRSLVTKAKLMEDGARDPVRFNITKNDQSAELRRGWCARCMDEREAAWNKKRAEWWSRLDAWLKLP